MRHLVDELTENILKFQIPVATYGIAVVSTIGRVIQICSSRSVQRRMRQLTYKVVCELDRNIGVTGTHFLYSASCKYKPQNT